jgi:hypothetical protein
MYYKLVLDNGHIGAGKSLETVRYFSGQNPVDIFDIAARIPRVKGKKGGTGVKLVQSVSRNEYLKGVKSAADDPYLKTRKKKKSNKRKKEVLFHS